MFDGHHHVLVKDHHSETLHILLLKSMGTVCSIKMGMHLGRKDQKVNKQVNSDDTGGEEERDCAEGVWKRNQI